MKRIRIHPDMSKELATECNTSKQTVYAALCYFNNSELAEEIRTRAKQKLLTEAQEIIITVNS